MCKHKTGGYYFSAYFTTEEGLEREIEGSYSLSMMEELERLGVEDVLVLFHCNLCDRVVEAEMPLDKVALWVQTHEEARATI